VRRFRRHVAFTWRPFGWSSPSRVLVSTSQVAETRPLILLLNLTGPSLRANSDVKSLVLDGLVRTIRSSLIR